MAEQVEIGAPEATVSADEEQVSDSVEETPAMSKDNETAKNSSTDRLARFKALKARAVRLQPYATLSSLTII